MRQNGKLCTTAVARCLFFLFLQNSFVLPTVPDQSESDQWSDFGVFARINNANDERQTICQILAKNRILGFERSNATHERSRTGSDREGNGERDKEIVF